MDECIDERAQAQVTPRGGGQAWGPDDILWGAESIGRELGNLPPDRVYYLVKKGLLKSAVVKASRKMMIGSRIELRKVFPRLAQPK